MATQTQTQDPLQGFIEQFMRMQEFKAQERQFGAQLALQTRNAEADELMAFSSLMAKTKNDAERQGLAQVFAQRAPTLAPIFEGLSSAIGSSLETQVATASATRTPEDIVLGLRTQEGLETTAGQRLAADAQSKELTERIRQFNLGFAQRTQEFATESAQRSRGLDLQAAGLAQQGSLGEMQLLGSAGLLPMTLQGELSTQIQGLAAEMEMLPAEDPRRVQLATQIAERRTQMERLESMNQAAFSGGGAGGVAGGLQPDNLPGLMETQRKLLTDLQNAKSPAEEAAIRENYAAVTALIRQVAPNLGVNPLAPEPPGIFERVMGSMLGSFSPLPLGGQ